MQLGSVFLYNFGVCEVSVSQKLSGGKLELYVLVLCGCVVRVGVGSFWKWLCVVWYMGVRWCSLLVS